MVGNINNWIWIVEISSDWTLSELEPSSRSDTGDNKLNSWNKLACFVKEHYIFHSQKYTHLSGFEVGTFGVKPFAGSNSRE